VLVCTGLLGWGASRVHNKDYAFRRNAPRTNDSGGALEASPSAFVLSFIVGQVGGWVAWFVLKGILFYMKFVSFQKRSLAPSLIPLNANVLLFVSQVLKRARR
jgi:uncharacterized membrane protein YeaQ/YmgE (transglycosylase-associated protein family)